MACQVDVEVIVADAVPVIAVQVASVIVTVYKVPLAPDVNEDIDAVVAPLLHK